ncbi:MAG: hypothetical protein M1609_18000 [Firmicutes bacterium]|nr:hypothetical protein [Bacillota bacterium]
MEPTDLTWNSAALEIGQESGNSPALSLEAFAVPDRWRRKPSMYSSGASYAAEGSAVVPVGGGLRG